MDTNNDTDIMLSMLYHDLVSPLQVVRACTDVIEMELQQNSAMRIELVRDMLEAAKRNERRLFEMVRTIRSVPQLEESRAVWEERVQPDAAIQTVCSDFRLILKEDVTLKWDFPPRITRRATRIREEKSPCQPAMRRQTHM
ncbi:MAG: hypothetical protein HY801_06485 [Candidatus Lindowbacteria bacterium]|nr:hypothetical protein [Candidatus Lindowbacteria bacterium]